MLSAFVVCKLESITQTIILCSQKRSLFQKANFCSHACTLHMGGDQLISFRPEPTGAYDIAFVEATTT